VGGPQSARGERQGADESTMNLALFDFDGTITTADTWTPFVRLTASAPRKAAGAIALLPVIVAYKLKLIRGSTARPIVAMLAFRGRSEEEIRLAGFRYAVDELPGTVRSIALDTIRWHQGRGDRVIVVSGSLDAYLQPWCATIGVDVICTELAVKDGVLTGRYKHGDCTGRRKADRLRERVRLADYETIYAYGDSVEDKELLSVAHRRFLCWREIS
jgi:HAD superfamily hydrolase (TIGR01490 family)